MGIVQDILDRQKELATIRAPWETRWTQVADVSLVTAEPFPYSPLSRIDTLVQGPRSPDRGRRLYDSTAVTAIDRLAAGMLNLVSPDATKWQNFGPDDPLAPEPTDEDEKRWYDAIRDYVFVMRYNPRCGFSLANLTAIRGACALGSAFLYMEESFAGDGTPGGSVPIRYYHVPLSQCFAAVNAQGQHDTMYRRFALSARAAAARWPGKVSTRLQQAAETTSSKDDIFEFIHAVSPRGEGGRARTNRDAPFSSHYIEVDGEHHIGSSGFFEFPYIPYAWERDMNSSYGESPVMKALADIQSLQVLAKAELHSAQTVAKPALLVAHDGVTNRINLNPGGINRGGLDGNGNPTIRPLNPNVPALNFAEQILAAKQTRVEKSLYIHLFQILIERASDTATEALLRANEKGELLGPAGYGFQLSHAMIAERELGILERKGAFRPGALLELPPTLQGRGVAARSRTPLDRIRRSPEMMGTQRTIETGALLAQLGMTEALDGIDPDAVMELSQEVNGAPHKIMRRHADRDEIRRLRAQQQQMMAMLEMAKSGVDTAAQVGEAADGVKRAGEVMRGAA